MRYLYLCIILIFLLGSPVYAAKISGRVHDSQNDPIGSVEVNLCHSGNLQKNVSTVLTKTDGLFSFDGVKPGCYRIVTKKRGWISSPSNEIWITREDEEQKVDIVIELTKLYKILVSIQFSSLLYVLFFGYLVLVFNFSVAPQPAKSATLLGWAFVLGSMVIGLFKVKFQMACLLILCGLPIPILLTWWGNKTGKEKAMKERKRMQEIEEVQKQYENKLESFKGKTGITCSELRPYGEADIESQKVEVKSSVGFLPVNTKIIVKGIEGSKLIVEPMI